MSKAIRSVCESCKSQGARWCFCLCDSCGESKPHNNGYGQNGYMYLVCDECWQNEVDADSEPSKRKAG